MKILYRLLPVILILSCSAEIPARHKNTNDNIAFGWATCKSLTQTGYKLTGGEGGSKIVLKSTGTPMDKEISAAVNEYGIVIFDGSAGPFIVSRIISFKGLTNKTIYGINGAELKTAFSLTDDIRAALDSANVKGIANDKGTYYLSNGKRVSEKIEYATRQAIIDYTGNAKEEYRESGIFMFSNCENIIIRNINFTGPGSVDVGGRDLIRMTSNDCHFWIDHCVFADGQKGHINISNTSNFCTISNCRFVHTVRSYSHAFSILIGGTLRDEDAGMLNVTLAGNLWDKGCKMRVPMVRSGHVHVYNNYYDCPGANGGVNARDASHLLVENCYWSKDTPKCFSASKASGYTLRGNYSERGIRFPENLGPEETVPYRYKLIETSTVPDYVRRNSGAILETSQSDL